MRHQFKKTRILKPKESKKKNYPFSSFVTRHGRREPGHTQKLALKNNLMSLKIEALSYSPLAASL